MVNEDLCLLRAPVNIVGRDGRAYAISPLTDALARAQSEPLLELHNIIPHVSWTHDELLANADKRTDRPYLGKWSLSLCALYGGLPVALLVAYLRNDNVRQEQRGLYIHRLAVTPHHQRNRLGTQMVQVAIDAYFRIVPGLEVITVQTNDDVDNQGVVDFYHSLGFEDYDRVVYPDKRDLLLRICPPRSRRPPTPVASAGYLNQSAVMVQHLATLLASVVK